MSEPAPEAETYGEKIEYDSTWSGPLNIPRHVTDIVFFIIFITFCLGWLGLAFYAFSQTDISELRNFIHNQLLWFEIDFTQRAWTYIVVLLGVCTFLSISYLIALSLFAKIIVFGVIFLILSSLMGFIGYLIFIYSNSEHRKDLAVTLIFCVIIFVVILVLLILNRKKVSIACEVIKESSKAVLFFPSTLLIPFFTYFLLIIVLLFALSVYFCLSNIPVNNEDKDGLIFFYHVINAFGFLWVANFVFYFAQMALAGTFATWYWSLDKTDVPHFTLARFMVLTLRYHVGTLAFGTLILAFCQLLRAMVEYLKHEAQRKNMHLVCLDFWIALLEKVCRAITTNAYIWCATHGTNFIKSAKDSFNLIMRNIMKFVIINKITGALIFVGTLLTVVLLQGLIWFVLRHYLSHDEFHAVTAAVLLGSILISTSFSTVLNVAIDTIFLNALEDFERNDGSRSKPYFMSPKLQSLFMK